MNMIHPRIQNGISRVLEEKIDGNIEKIFKAYPSPDELASCSVIAFANASLLFVSKYNMSKNIFLKKLEGGESGDFEKNLLDLYAVELDKILCKALDEKEGVLVAHKGGRENRINIGNYCCIKKSFEELKVEIDKLQAMFYQFNMGLIIFKCSGNVRIKERCTEMFRDIEAEVPFVDISDDFKIHYNSETITCDEMEMIMITCLDKLEMLVVDIKKIIMEDY